MSEPIPARDAAPGGDELVQAVRVLGPFAPPAGFQFEPEFAGPPPRTVPAELYRGPYCRKQKLAIIGWFVAGLVLLGCSLLPIMRLWGLYLLPLKYLHWIGAVVTVGSGIAWLRYAFTRGPFVYVEEGTPLLARILALLLRTKVVINGVPSVCEYAAWFEHRDPATGALVVSMDTHDVSASTKDNVDLSYRVGDYVTAVYLPDRKVKSLRLYGFLDLRPGVGVVPKVKPDEWAVLKLIATIVGIGAFFFVLAWNVYAFGRYQPLVMSMREHALPFALGVVVLGGGLLGFIAWETRKTWKKSQAASAAAAAEGGAVEVPWRPKLGLLGQGLIMTIVLLFGGGLLGGATMLCWAFSLNAMADRSRPELRPVEIREMWMTTHNFIFREYTIEYQLVDDPAGEKQKLMTTPWHMFTFGDSRTGLALVRQGFLGWPWVETILPLPIEPAPNPNH